MTESSFSLLFDENISYRVVKYILHLFPGSEAAKRLRLTAKEDLIVWEKAKAGGFAIVTYDEDYEVLNHLRGWPPKVILIRSGNLSNDEVVALLTSKFSDICNFLLDREDGTRGVLELYHV